MIANRGTQLITETKLKASFTDRQKDGNTKIWTDKKTDRQKDRQTKRDTKRQMGKIVDRQTKRHTDKKTDRQNLDRQKNKSTHF